MILDTFKTDTRESLCAELQTLLTSMTAELAHYDHVLAGDLEPSQRDKLTLLRNRRARAADNYRARLNALTSAQYHDNQAVMDQRIRAVA